VFQLKALDLNEVYILYHIQRFWLRYILFVIFLGGILILFIQTVTA